MPGLEKNSDSSIHRLRVSRQQVPCVILPCDAGQPRRKAGPDAYGQGSLRTRPRYSLIMAAETQRAKELDRHPYDAALQDPIEEDTRRNRRALISVPLCTSLAARRGRFQQNGRRLGLSSRARRTRGWFVLPWSRTYTCCVFFVCPPHLISSDGEKDFAIAWISISPSTVPDRKPS